MEEKHTWILPQNLQGEPTLPTPRFSFLQENKCLIFLHFCCFKHCYSNLFQQFWESNTVSQLGMIGEKTDGAVWFRDQLIHRMVTCILLRYHEAGQHEQRRTTLRVAWTPKCASPRNSLKEEWHGHPTYPTGQWPWTCLLLYSFLSFLPRGWSGELCLEGFQNQLFYEPRGPQNLEFPSPLVSALWALVSQQLSWVWVQQATGWPMGPTELWGLAHAPSNSCPTSSVGHLDFG